MTYWADNIRFIKEVQDSKYEKIEEAIVKVSLFLLNLFQPFYKSRQFNRRSYRWEVLRFFKIIDSKILQELDFMQILNCLKGKKPFTNMKHNCLNDIVCKKRATIQHNQCHAYIYFKQFMGFESMKLALVFFYTLSIYNFVNENVRAVILCVCVQKYVPSSFLLKRYHCK